MQVLNRKLAVVRKQVPMTDAERATREDLAAAYRLVAMFAWDALLATHISARVPDEDGAFLINPFGLMFEEVTASSLVKVNLDGEILQDTPYSINQAGYVIHSAIHGARHDAGCVIHLHTPDGVAVSSVQGGLLPLNQLGMLVRTQVATHEYEGVSLDEAERERLVADLGDRFLMFLLNHGTLAVGASIPEAFAHMYWLETACSLQVRTLSMSLPAHRASEDVVARTQSMMKIGAESRAEYCKSVIWPALLRKLDRTNPGYRD